MKAWVLSDKTGHNHYSNLVWAKSAGKAKMQANKDGYFAYQTKLMNLERCFRRGIFAKFKGTF